MTQDSWMVDRITLRMYVRMYSNFACSVMTPKINVSFDAQRLLSHEIVFVFVFVFVGTVSVHSTEHESIYCVNVSFCICHVRTSRSVLRERFQRHL